MRNSAGFLAVFAATAVLIPFLILRAHAWRLVTAPDHRRLHSGEIPLVGGPAMGLALLAGYLLLRPYNGGWQWLATAGAIVITLIGGLLDDRHELSAAPKFGFQIVASAVLVLWGGAELRHLGHLLTSDLFGLGAWSIPLSIFAVIGVMNAVNMSDGLDGLAGSLALAACIGLGFAAVLSGATAVFAVICLLAGAVTAFLLYNARSPWRAQASVYMGETGSSLLGLLLAWVTVQLAMDPNPATSPITMVWILGVPLTDTVVIMTRRALHGRSPFKGDREHVHHLLLTLGCTTGQTVMILFGVTLLFSAIALIAAHFGVAEHVMFYSAMAIVLVYGAAAEIYWRRFALRRKAAETEEDDLATAEL